MHVAATTLTFLWYMFPHAAIIQTKVITLQLPPLYTQKQKQRTEVSVREASVRADIAVLDTEELR